MNNPYYNIENIIKVSTAIKENKDVEFRSTIERDGRWVKYTNMENGLPDFQLYDYRVKSKFKQYRLAVLLDCNKEPFVFTVNDIKSEVPTENNINFVKWLTDWIEYEV